MLQLQNAGLLRCNHARRQWGISPALRGLLTEEALQQAPGVHEAAVFAFVEHCRNLLDKATALNESSAQVCLSV